MTIPIAWHPDEQTKSRSRLAHFLRQCGESDFASLHRRSVEDIEWYTSQLLDFLGIEFDPPCSKILDISEGVEWARWCVGGGLNISKYCLSSGLPHHPAVSWEGEEGATKSWSYRALKIATVRCSAGLRSLGISKGDAVGIHLPMVPETVAVLLALARIGAVAVPLFSGYGPAAIASRMRDTGARLIFTSNAFPRRGKQIQSKAAVDEALAGCPSIAHVVVVPRIEGVDPQMTPGRDLTWAELCEMAGDNTEEPTLAEDPLLIIYSSGTTGTPKGIVHTHAGFPLKAAADMAFHFDAGPTSRVAWFTDIGWMMGPWLIYGTLILGGTVTLYDGAPDFPHAGRPWAFAERLGADILGVSPTLIRALQTHGDDWPRHYKFSNLRYFGSTGEPWNVNAWRWLFECAGSSRIPIINYSGGTECSGGILGNNPLLPIKPAALAAPCLGIDADVVGQNGQPLRGEVGELVIRKPWLGMARGFFNSRQRYLDTYWSTYPGIWRHGDFAEIDDDGFWFIHGRSDDTIKVAGKRVAPAEVEASLLRHPDVADAVAVGIPDEAKGAAIAAFIVARNGHRSDGLARELIRFVAEDLGNPLRPSVLRFVRAIPKTRNGKVLRRLVRDCWMGAPAGDMSMLEDPSILDDFKPHP